MFKWAFYRIFVIILLLNFSITVAAETTVVISGLPQLKDMSEIQGTEQLQISDSEKWNYRCEIVKKDNKYYWASRENRELNYSQAGEFYNFVEPGGAGYVRVIVAEGKIFYMEHLTLGLRNITYWGAANEFNP